MSNTTWSRFFEGSDLFCLIAEVDGQICGIAHCIYHYSTTSIKKSCYLNDLFTIGNLRGQGIGKALIAAVYARALKEGAARVYWHTNHSNVNARALYDQVADYEGFIVYKHILP
ncbi:N-acetyltransferase family protein [Candidimonas sp. SYP-B2681]|uniref:GNAT family N-acetyltransferase n=1 Tax=Candidimonas sp. SYP-B2681 TaxID=2497686 RepID=UPI0035122C75